jgi:arylsulfatase A-like enzyme/dienelactone hydrolase
MNTLSQFPFFRIAALATISLVLTANMSSAWAGNDSDRRPNIVFILLDNVGKDWIRCYGSQENQTPNIDHLCYTGMKFRNFYVTPVCSTTRTMLLTGRYPFRTGWHTHHDSAIYGGGYLDWRKEVTFARVLRDAGYQTCISGKWQINDLFDPEQADALTRHGFAEHCIWPEAKPGLPAHKKRYWDAYAIENGKRIDTTGKFGPDVFTEFSIDYIKRNRDRPFLLYQSAILTHIPVTTTPLSANEDASPREKFAGMLRYADQLIGRIVKTLEETGLRDNTLILIATDNGTDTGTDQGMPQSLGGRRHGRVSEEGIYSLTERGINMPLIVNCPGWIAAGCQSDALLNAADILPTLADLAGADLPSGLTIDGLSFAPVIRDNHDRDWPRSWTFTQYADQRAVRDDRFKLYSSGQMYDLAADPLERINIADDAATQLDVADSKTNLSAVLKGLPPNADWPWTFRSISARKMRSAKDAARRREWVETNHSPPPELATLFAPPAQHRGELGGYPSPLVFADGSPVVSANDWQRRRREILDSWQGVMGRWPKPIEKPRHEQIAVTRRSQVTQRQLKIGIGIGGEMVDALMIVPDGDGPFPAVVVTCEDAKTSLGLGYPLRDYGWQLARRGFVTLSIGKPDSAVKLKDNATAEHRDLNRDGSKKPVNAQALSALTFAAAGAHVFLSQRAEVYPDRIGILEQSVSGRSAMFASCLSDQFACAAWPDRGIVLDENRSGMVDLLALMAARPLLVSRGSADSSEVWPALNHVVAANRLLGYRNRVAMTQRTGHAPTEACNEQVCRFFEWWLQEK